MITTESEYFPTGHSSCLCWSWSESSWSTECCLLNNSSWLSTFSFIVTTHLWAATIRQYVYLGVRGGRNTKWEKMPLAPDDDLRSLPYKWTNLNLHNLGNVNPAITQTRPEIFFYKSQSCIISRDTHLTPLLCYPNLMCNSFILCWLYSPVWSKLRGLITCNYCMIIVRQFNKDQVHSFMEKRQIFTEIWIKPWVYMQRNKTCFFVLCVSSWWRKIICKQTVIFQMLCQKWSTLNVGIILLPCICLEYVSWYIIQYST